MRDVSKIKTYADLDVCILFTLFVFTVRVIAFACEAAAAHHPDRLRNALFEGSYDGGFFLLLVVLYASFRKW